MAFCRRSRFSFVTAIFLLSLASTVPVAATPIGNRNILGNGNNAAGLPNNPPAPSRIADRDILSDNMAQAPTNYNLIAEALQLYAEGVQQLDKNQFSAAIQKFQQALAIYQKIDYRQNEANILNNIGLVYRRQKQYSQALKFYQQALPLLRKIDDKVGERITLYNIGLLHRQLGQYPQALEFLNQASAIFTNINDLRLIVGERVPQQNVLIAIGQVYENWGQTDKARDFYRQAEQLTAELSKQPREREVFARSSFGEVSILSDEDNKIARALIKQDQKASAMRLYLEGVQQRDRRQFSAALEKFNEALALYRTIGDRTGEALTLQKIGTVYFMMGNPRTGRNSFQKALEFFQQARTIYKATGNRRGEAQTLNNIGVTYLRLRQPRTAVSFLRQSVAIYKQLGDKAGVARAQKNLNAALVSATGDETILIDDNDYELSS